MARRAGVWVLGGAAAATGALLAAPDAYAWLRLKAGLATPDPEVEAAALHDDEAEATFDTREARLSLRARLSETSDADADADADATPPAPATERPLAARPRPARTDVEPMRKAVDEARTRMLETARKATGENGPAA
jgi:hypothetical protein